MTNFSLNSSVTHHVPQDQARSVRFSPPSFHSPCLPHLLPPLQIHPGAKVSGYLCLDMPSQGPCQVGLGSELSLSSVTSREREQVNEAGPELCLSRGLLGLKGWGKATWRCCLVGEGLSKGQEHFVLKQRVLVREGQVLSARMPPPSCDLYRRHFP